MKRALLLLALLAFAPVARADPTFTGHDALLMDYAETGDVSGHSRHADEEFDYLREATYQLSWATKATYDLERHPLQPNSFFGSGDIVLHVTGSVSVTTSHRGETRSGTCTLDEEETMPGLPMLTVEDGRLLMKLGTAYHLPEWECTGEEVAIASMILIVSGDTARDAPGASVPGALAARLGYVFSPEEWDDTTEGGRAAALMQQGYVVARPTMGTQTMGLSADADPDHDALGGLFCGDLADDRPAVEATCNVRTTSTLTLATTSGPDAAETAGATSEGFEEKGTPGVGVVAALGALVAVAALRRRA